MSAKLKTLLKQVNEAAKEIVDAIQTVDARIDELTRQRQQIGEAPVTRDAFMAYLSDSIDERARRFGEQISRQLRDVDTGFFAMERQAFRIPFLTGATNLPVTITEEACYWYLKPAMMERFAEIADSMAFPESGESGGIEKRREMVASIDTEITKLRIERAELASALQKAGLVSG